MSPNLLRNCRGAMMLMLLVVIIIGSIIALQILPGEEMVTRRSVERSLDVELSQLREAVDLAYLAGDLATDTVATITLPPSDLAPDQMQASLSAMIASLSHYGYLRSDSVRDPTVPVYLWGSDHTHYWQFRENVASNPSFEVTESGIVLNWKDYDGGDIKAGDNTHASASENFLQNMMVDDYPYQNKLGNLLSSGGSALELTN